MALLVSADMAQILRKHVPASRQLDDIAIALQSPFPEHESLKNSSVRAHAGDAWRLIWQRVGIYFVHVEPVYPSELSQRQTLYGSVSPLTHPPRLLRTHGRTESMRLLYNPRRLCELANDLLMRLLTDSMRRYSSPDVYDYLAEACLRSELDEGKQFCGIVFAWMAHLSRKPMNDKEKEEPTASKLACTLWAPPVAIVGCEMPTLEEWRKALEKRLDTVNADALVCHARCISKHVSIPYTSGALACNAILRAMKTSEDKGVQVACLFLGVIVMHAMDRYSEKVLRHGDPALHVYSGLHSAGILEVPMADWQRVLSMMLESEEMRSLMLTRSMNVDAQIWSLSEKGSVFVF
jgi:hypothetical protein